MITDAAPKQNGIIENAIIHIEKNYRYPIEIDELCKLCHLSRSSLFEAFKKRTGVSPINYKHTVMIQHALDMLAHTNMTVDEISQAVGFSSSNYFRTVFTKLTGKSPKEVR
jgi:transcriptional regulator GlxA family with amidase domain